MADEWKDLGGVPSWDSLLGIDCHEVENKETGERRFVDRELFQDLGEAIANGQWRYEKDDDAE